jgi:hypothetical protein
MIRTSVFAGLALLLAAASPGAALAQRKSDSDKDAAKELARKKALQAQVRSYRCTNKEGHRFYGSTVPSQCRGALVEALSAQGTVLFRIEPPLTPEQRAAKEAEAQKAAAAEEARREAQNAARVQARRAQALLQTYSSEQDIETVRQRAIRDNEAAMAPVRARIAQLKSRQAQLAQEMAKYKNADDAPPKVQEDARAVAYDLSLQEQLLASRQRESAAINAKYDEEKRKYVELTRGAQRR